MDNADGDSGVNLGGSDDDDEEADKDNYKNCDNSDALSLSNQANSQNLSNLVQTQVFLTNLKSKEKIKVVKLWVS